MEIEPFLKVLPDNDSISITDLEDLFVPQTESPGYLTGVDEQQMAAGCVTLYKACRRVVNWLKC